MLFRSLQTSATNVVQGINELKNGSITFGGNKTFSGTVVAKGNATVQGVMTVQGTSNLGTVGTGTWQATAVSPTYGGTGVNNGSKTITVGAQSITLNSNASSSSNVTLPASGTLSTLAGSETLTNKTLGDSTTLVQNTSDTTKKLQFSAQGISGSTTRTLYAPNVNGTIVTTGDSATVTNTMLAGSIANNKLSNSSVTVGTQSISLGGSATSIQGLTYVKSTTFEIGRAHV